MKPVKSFVEWPSLLFVLFGIGCRSIRAESEQFNFDSLYPKSSYTKAIEECVGVWGTLDQLLRNKTVSSIYFTHSIDRSVGQLVLAQKFLQAVMQEKRKPYPEELHYLSRVVGTIAERCQQLQINDNDRKECLHDRISKLRKLVEQGIIR